MSFIQIILYPFSLLYGLGLSIRNWLFDMGIFKTYAFNIKIIAVGNLSVGGTGKTPMVEYLIELLSENNNVAVLSRGYKRKTKGFLYATEKSGIEDIGDEPYQIYRKYKNRVNVFVGEDRVSAIVKIRAMFPEINCVLLDDAFQHRKLARDLNILLSNYSKPFYTDSVLPSGRLRETRKGADRSDVVVITKVPNHVSDVSRMESEMKKYLNKEQMIFQSKIQYGKEVQVSGEQGLNERDQVVAFTGIANPDSFVDFLRNNYDLVSETRFPDHWNYTQTDIEKILKEAEERNAKVITTEKDAIKLMSQPFSEILKDRKVSVYYFPIKMSFLEKGKEFDGMVLDSLKS